MLVISERIQLLLLQRNNADSSASPGKLREDIRNFKRLAFGHRPKGGTGVQPESKSFEVVLFYSIWILF